MAISWALLIRKFVLFFASDPQCGVWYGDAILFSFYVSVVINEGDPCILILS